MSCIPGLVEGFFITFASMRLLNFTFAQGGILGFIIAAVSPAVVVPSMLTLMENNIGTKKGIFILGFSILINQLESVLKTKLQIASLLGVMTIGFVIIEKLPNVGERLSNKFNKIWILAEILLFVLVGAQVDVNIALKAGEVGIMIIVIGLIGRSIGVIISLIGTEYNWKERLFCIIAYIPKATVQAAMGAVPLSLGVESGDIILAIAVLSILITAPLGAIGIHYSSEKLLVE